MDEFLKALPSLGIGGVLAGIIFYFYQKRETDHSKVLEEINKRQEGQTNLLVNVIKDNTSSNITLAVLIKSLHDHLITARQLDDRRSDK